MRRVRIPLYKESAMYERIMNWWRALLMRVAGGVEIRASVELTALAPVVGGLEEAMILKRVLDWTRSNERRDARGYYRDGQWWTVMSYERMASETGYLSANACGRICRKLEKAGWLVSTRWKTNGVKGYRVNEAALLAAITPQNVVRFRISGVQNGTSVVRNRIAAVQNRTGVVRNGHNRISSKESSTNGDKQISYPPTRLTDADDLSPMRDDDEVARLVRLAGGDESRALRALEKARARGGVRNVYGYAARILQNEGGGLRPTPYRMVSERTESNSSPSVLCRDERTDGPGDARWDAAMSQLQLQLDRYSFAHLQDARLVDRTDSRLTVQVRDAHSAEMLNRRLYRTVKRIIRDVNGSELDVTFVAPDAVAAG